MAGAEGNGRRLRYSQYPRDEISSAVWQLQGNFWHRQLRAQRIFAGFGRHPDFDFPRRALQRVDDPVCGIYWGFGGLLRALFGQHCHLFNERHCRYSRHSGNFEPDESAWGQLRNDCVCVCRNRLGRPGARGARHRNAKQGTRLCFGGAQHGRQRFSHCVYPYFAQHYPFCDCQSGFGLCRHYQGRNVFGLCRADGKRGVFVGDSDYRRQCGYYRRRVAKFGRCDECDVFLFVGLKHFRRCHSRCARPKTQKPKLSRNHENRADPESPKFEH